MIGKYSIQRFVEHVSGYFGTNENGEPTEIYTKAEPLTDSMVTLYYVPFWKEWYRNFGGSEKRLRNILRQDLIYFLIAGSENKPEEERRLVMLAVTTFCKALARDGILLEEWQLHRMNLIKYGDQATGDIIRDYYEEQGYEWEGMPLPPPKGKKVPTWESLHDENGKLINPKDKEVLKLFPNKREYNNFIGSCYCKDGSLQKHKEMVRKFLRYRIQDKATIKPSLLAEFLLRHALITVITRTIQRDFEKLLKQDKQNTTK